MSRIGKKPISIPESVTVSVTEDTIEVKGPKGVLKMPLRPEVSVVQEDKSLVVSLKKDTKQSRKMWGTTRALVANMIRGVIEGYEKRLEIEGVGFRAAVQGKNLELSLGFSHPVKVEPPDGIDFKVEKNIIIVSGISKEDVGRIASAVRALKKPEPYKGKGIHYVGEVIRRKAGKKAIAG